MEYVFLPWQANWENPQGLGEKKKTSCTRFFFLFFSEVINPNIGSVKYIFWNMIKN